MAILNWPPEKRFDYRFREGSDLDIVIEYSKDKSRDNLKKSEEIDR